MLRNVKDAWWRSMVQLRDDVVGLDAAILSPPAGLGGVRPPRQLHRPARRLHELQGAVPARPARRPATSARTAARRDSFTEARAVQPDVQDLRRPGRGRRRRSPTCGPRRRRACSSTSPTCCRPRRKKPPFGIAQVGKSFRNEITPGNFIFRTREFEQMEMEFFVPPAEGAAVVRVLVRRAAAAGTSTSASRPSSCGCGPTTPTSCRHYSAGTSDVEFLFPWGWDELEGIANRTDYDLTQHAELSGERLEYFDQATGERYVPHVIEPAAGATRTMMAFLWPPTTRTRSAARRARCCASTRAWRRTRWRCCRCRRRTR